MEMFEPMCYSICYGSALLFVWIAMISTGAVTTNVALQGAKTVDHYCETKELDSHKGWDRVTAHMSYVDELVSEVNTYMCS